MCRFVGSGLVVVAMLLVAPGCASWRGAELYQSGSAALEEGEVDVAVAKLERAAALVPEASEVQNHLGLAYVAAGRPADAAQRFQRAVDLDCENAAARENLLAARHALSLGEATRP